MTDLVPSDSMGEKKVETSEVKTLNFQPEWCMFLFRSNFQFNSICYMLYDIINLQKCDEKSN